MASSECNRPDKPIYEILLQHEKINKKFNIRERILRIHIVSPLEISFDDFFNHNHNILEKLLMELMVGVAPHDRVKLRLHKPNIKHMVSVPFVKSTELTVEKILTAIEEEFHYCDCLFEGKGHASECDTCDWFLDNDILVYFTHAALPIYCQ